jgi:hypothetical protein
VTRIEEKKGNTLENPVPQATRNDLPNTERRDAVVHQTGSTVAHSVPVRGAANTPTSSDRNSDASLCSADSCGDASTHHHAKSGQGSGDGVPGGGTAAEVPCFNQIQINRNSPPGRSKHCGKFSFRGQTPGRSETRFHRANCKCWNCSFCGPRKEKRYRHAIRTIAEKLQLRRFISLTLDPKKVEGDPVRYLNALWAAMRVYLKRKFGVAPQYIRILEFQKNGNPHLHILIDRYIRQAWLKEAWTNLGGGWSVDIRYVDVHRISNYLSKYLTKSLRSSAPLRSRRVTSSRGIKLLEKAASATIWERIKAPISRLYVIYESNVTSFSLDNEGILESFICNGEAA